MHVKRKREEERRGDHVSDHRGVGGDLQESICSSHYAASGPELGSPGLSSKSFSLAERSYKINYIRKFCIKYTIPDSSSGSPHVHISMRVLRGGGDTL